MILIYEDKESVYENTQVLNYFLEDKLFTFMTGYALNVNKNNYERIIHKGF